MTGHPTDMMNLTMITKKTFTITDKMEQTNINVKFTALNCHGLKGNTLYVNKLLNEHDVIFLSEMWILESEKNLINNYKRDFEIYFTPAKIGHSGRPYGSNMMLIKITVKYLKLELILQEEFTTIVKLTTIQSSLLIT